jgi:hypothetical protein
MTREAQIRQTAADWLRYNHPKCTQDMLVEAFRCGAQWADEHPCISEEEQVGMGGLGMIWQKKHLINKAIDILIDFANDGYLIDIHNHEEFEKQFRKRMEE